MTVFFDGAEPRFRRIGFLVWCDMLELPVVHGLLGPLFLALLLAAVVALASVFDGEPMLGELLILGVALLAVAAIMYINLFRKWSWVRIPAGTVVLGWRGIQPALIKDTWAIRRGAMRGLHGPILVAEVPWRRRPVTLVRRGGSSVKLLVTLSISRLDAAAVVDWLQLSVGAPELALQRAFDTYLEHAHDSDTHAPEAICDEIKRNLGRIHGWLTNLRVRIEVAPEPDDSVEFRGVP